MFLPSRWKFHHFKGWYDHPLCSYSVTASDTLRDLVTLTFDLLTLVSDHKTAIYELPVKILTSPFDCLTLIFLWGTTFRRFKEVFCWFLHWISWMSAIFLLRSSWLTDLERVSRDAYLTLKISTKFEADTTIRCLVIALLLLIRYVTLWPLPLTFWPWSVVVHGRSRAQSLHQLWISYS